MFFVAQSRNGRKAVALQKATTMDDNKHNSAPANGLPQGKLFQFNAEIPLPSNTDAEASVVGSILVDNSVMTMLAERLCADDFYEPFFAEVWTRCKDLIAGGRTASLVAIAQEFRGRKIGDVCMETYLASVADVSVASIEELEGYVVEILHQSKCRSAIFIARDMATAMLARDGSGTDIGRFIDRLEANASRGLPPDVGPDDAVMPWPEMGAAAYRGIVGEMVDLATQNSEADRVAVLGTVLVLVGAAFGRGPSVSVGDTLHHGRLFAAVVGESSRARKGTSEAPVRTFLEATTKYLHSTVAPLRLSPGPLSSGEGLAFALRDSQKDKEGNVTDKGVEDKRLAVVDGELGAVLRSMQREGNTISARIRSAWDGSDIEPLTKHDRLKVTKPHLCIVGHITRQELRPLLTASDIWNGFANRFLWLVVRRTKLVPRPSAMPADAVDQLGKRLAEAMMAAHALSDVPFTPAAEVMWDEAYRKLAAERPGLAGVVTARSEAQARRVALIYALLDNEKAVDVPHLEAALAVVEYAAASARLIFGEAEADPLLTRVLDALAGGPLTATELRKALSNHVSRAALNAALEHLQSVGRITGERVPTGGRPRQVWKLTGTA